MALAAAQLAQLAPPLANALTALNADPAVGGGLTIVSGWRSSASQIALRKAHCGSTPYDINQKPSSQCSPPTAIPGTSNHEVTNAGKPWALAADLGGPLTAAHSVMAKYGLHTPVTGEPWHFELTNTAALRTLAATGAQPAPDGSLTVPGVGSVNPAPVTLTKAQSGPSWGLRLATFVGGLMLAIVGGWFLSKTGGRPHSGRRHQAERLADLTDDGGDQADPASVEPAPGDQGAIADAGTDNAGAITAAV